MDDLANSYLALMEDPRPFIFFDVERPLRDIPWPLDESLERVPPHFRPADRLKRLGVLYLALLGCPPFHGLQDHEIRDVRKPVPRGKSRHTCPHRDQLLIQLADSFLLYEGGCEIDNDWRDLYQSMQMGLRQIRPFVIILQNLKQRNRKPTDKNLRGKANRYQEYYSQLVDAIPRLTSADYYYGREPRPGSSQANIRRHHETLLTNLYLEFTEYLAERASNTYSERAIFESMTSILNTFAITNDRNQAYTTGSIRRFILREQKRRRDTFFGDNRPRK
jgi:hypothetical protein